MSKHEEEKITCDLERQLEGATKVSCGGSGDVIIENTQTSRA